MSKRMPTTDQLLSLRLLFCLTDNRWYCGSQGWAEQIAFVKLLQSLDSLDVLPLGGGDGSPDLDVATLQYLGLSAGAVNGSAVLSYLPEIRAAGLLVGGGRQAEWNIHGADSELLPQLQQSLPNMTPSEIWAGFVLYQLGMDPQEPHNHAIHLYRSPHPLGPPQRASLLITEGIGDSREFAPREAEQREVLGGVVDRVGADVPVPEPISRALDREIESFFAFP